MRTRVIVFANQKGGVGKSTTAANLWKRLNQTGHRTLLLDMDPQGHATVQAGLDPDSQDYTIYDVLHNATRPAYYAITAPRPEEDVIPANLDLAAAEIELSSKIGRETLLTQALAAVIADEQYEFILIDTPPNTGLLTLNALGAATEVIAPVTAEVLPLRGLSKLQETIHLMQPINPACRLTGIVATRVDNRNNLSGAIVDELRREFGPLVLQTTIPINVDLAEAPAAGQTIFDYAPTSKGAQAYSDLAEELINGEV